MGYDGLFFGRLDYADKERRMRDREMEMVWRGDRSDTSGEADLLTGALFHAYRCQEGKIKRIVVHNVLLMLAPLPDFVLTAFVEM